MPASKRLPDIAGLPVATLPESAEIFMVPATGARATVTLKPGETRTLKLHLTHPGSVASITVLQRCDHDETSAFRVEINHDAPDTKAETIIKTLATGTAKTDAAGIIRIAPGATGCESYFNHHALAFGRASVKSWPALEIANNEVKCSHAATIRTITDADLFCLRSRGIDPESAKNMLIETYMLT